MKFLFEEGDIVMFHNVDGIPNDMLWNSEDEDEYDPAYRQKLREHEEQKHLFFVTEVDDHGETVYVERLMQDNGATYCFPKDFFKPSKQALNLLLESIK